MTSARRVGFILVPAIFSVLLLPRPADAQSGFVTSSGVESWSDYEYTDNGLVLVGSGSNVPATFSFSYNALDSYGDYYVNMAIFGGAWSVSDGGIIYGSPVPYPSANVFIYEPNFEFAGNYFTAGVDTVADITASSGEGYSITSFQSVPEPSSIVPASTAVLVILVCAWMRGVRPRPRRWASWAIESAGRLLATGFPS